MNAIIEQTRQRPSGQNPRTAWTDEKLLLEYRDRDDRPAFEELVHRYEKELFGYLRNYLGDPEMAEDVFQQTFLQVHLKCDQFEPERKFRPWLYAVATNQAIDFQRRNGRHRMASLDRRIGGDTETDNGAFIELFDSPTRGPVEESESSEERDYLHRAVDELPEQTRSFSWSTAIAVIAGRSRSWFTDTKRSCSAICGTTWGMPRWPKTFSSRHSSRSI
jgi:RNA polymerase sigma-70 factor (ECF subfamily)